MAKALEIFPRILEQVWPLAKKRRRALPDGIRELSRLLTSQRGLLKQSYWAHPPFISAYLYYFLPWNIIRIGRLFAGLDLPAPELDGDGRPIILDAGSGPLALPLALWLSRPDWRDIPLDLLALDKNRQPLDLGGKIFSACADALKYPLWNIRLAVGNVESLAKKFSESNNFNPRPCLISMANVLNEFGQFKRGGHGTQRFQHTEYRGENDSFTENDAGGDDYAQNLFEAWSPLFGKALDNAALLFVEPGTRLGGASLMRLRESALLGGLSAISPCPHNNACPLLMEKGRAGSRLGESWCHFVFSAEGAPKWLFDLSKEARLPRRDLSLSFLLLNLKRRKPRKFRPDNFAARVVSHAFPIPGLPGKARYACGPFGKNIMPGAENIPYGALAMAAQSGKRDEKSGAMFIEPPIAV